MSTQRSSIKLSSQDVVFKILCVGDSGSGKTCFVRRYVYDTFTRQTKATLGVDYALKTILVPNSGSDEMSQVTLQIWDIAGQERVGQMTRVYYQNADGVLVLHDVTREDGLTSALAWKKDVDSRVTTPEGLTLPSLLVTTKVDLCENGISSKELVEIEKKAIEEYNFTGYIATSSAQGINVTKAFDVLVTEMSKRTSARVQQLNDKDGLLDEGTSKMVKNALPGNNTNTSSCCAGK